MKIPVIISSVVGLFAIVGGLYSLDNTYARSDQLCRIEQSLDRKILSDDARNVQRRQWELLRHYGEQEGRKLQEYKELENERQRILRELQR